MTHIRTRHNPPHHNSNCLQWLMFAKCHEEVCPNIVEVLVIHIFIPKPVPSAPLWNVSFLGGHNAQQAVQQWKKDVKSPSSVALCALKQPGSLRILHRSAIPRQSAVDAPFMHQGLGSRWKVPGSELAFPTIEIFQTRSLGFTCRIWLAHSLEVNNFVVSFFFPPSNRILVFSLSSFGSVSQFCSQAGTLSWLLQKGWLRTLGPSCCPWAVLLYWHRLDVVQLFTVGTVSDMVTYSRPLSYMVLPVF